MKKMMISLFMTIVLISCQRNTGTNATISQAATSGSWRVTLFTDSGNNETTDFNGYSFTFNNNGTVTAVKNGVSVTGSWNVNSSSTRFTIDLGPKTDANKPLGELTDDWVILSNTNTEIRLTDDNASSNEFLTFSKN